MHPYRSNQIIEIPFFRGKKTLFGKLRTYFRKYLVNKHGTYLKRHPKPCKHTNLKICYFTSHCQNVSVCTGCGQLFIVVDKFIPSDVHDEHATVRDFYGTEYKLKILRKW